MDFNFDNLKRAIDQLKEVSFFQRLFGWGKIKSQLIDANGDLQRLAAIVENLKNENAKLANNLELEKSMARNLQESNTHLLAETQVTKKQFEGSIAELATLKESNNSYLKRGRDLANDLAMAQQEIKNSESNLQLLRTQVTQLQKEDEFRKTEHSNAMSTLGKITTAL